MIGDGAVFLAVLHATDRHGITGAVAGKSYGELGVVGRDLHTVMHVESRMRPC